MKFAGIGRSALLAGLTVAPLAGSAFAQEAKAAADKPDTVFVLGRIIANPTDSEGQHIGGSSIGAEEMRKLDARTVDQAIDLVPGATASNTGGSRNERLIYVRGFDRFQTTLSLDGVRIYLPADNRIDFGRFLTADISEVQVAKGYTSVLDGPGGLGGEINLVTRKPSKPFEAELDATTEANANGDWNGNTVSALLGTKQDKFYVQGSGSYARRGNFDLSDDFKPVVPSLENGGERAHSSSNDWSVNLKAGFTPNDTDEYAISYVKQSGAKNAPYHISDTASTRYWSWPYWDMDNIYFISHTQLGDSLSLKTRVYRTAFQNLLSSFDDAGQTKQSLPRAFDSYYDDTAWGAEASLGWTVTSSNTLTGAFHFRDDEHNERQLGFIRTPPSPINPSANAPYIEPWQQDKEDTYSVAAEDVQKLGANVDLVVGASYDWTDLKVANDVNASVTGTTIANSVISFTPVNYPLKDMNALNGQAAVVWRVDPSAKLHFSISSRTRFPTIFERFSSRFGTAIPNASVKPERATNYEIGGDFDPIDSFHVKGSVFYSDIDDALVQVPVGLAAPFGTVSQTRNAGDGTYYGAELEATADVTRTFRLGGNVSWIHRGYDQIPPIAVTGATLPPTTGADPTNAGFEPQGVPDFKAFIYADWQAAPFVTVTPSLEMASSRWTVTSSSLISPPRFYKTGSYTLLNLVADFNVSKNVSVLVGGKNLTDENYTLVDGFPEEGRSYYVSLRLKN